MTTPGRPARPARPRRTVPFLAVLAGVVLAQALIIGAFVLLAPGALT